MPGALADWPVVAAKPRNGGGAKGLGRSWFICLINRDSGRSHVGEQRSPSKSFDISKREVWDAYEVVKANQGAAGVDGCSIEEFESDLKNNLYRIWNRSVSCKLRWTCR